MKCWEQSVLQFRISSLMTDPSPKGIYGGGLAFSCYNGTKWIGLVIEECIYNNETILPSDEKCSRFYEEAMIWNIDDNPPISVASATSPPDGAEYSFDTWIANNVKVTISTSDAGVGYDSSSFPVYCTDTTDTCEPSIFINSGVNISTEGISYIRYYSNDTVGNKEETKSKIIKIDTTGPNVTINSPLNISYNTGIINFNVTTNDLFNYIGNCSYSLNDGVTNYSINTSYCYQETANVSTECGGLATGVIILLKT